MISFLLNTLYEFGVDYGIYQIIEDIKVTPNAGIIISNSNKTGNQYTLFVDVLSLILKSVIFIYQLSV
jgi:hypothetical protein